jgi:hypothetical protein
VTIQEDLKGKYVVVKEDNDNLGEWGVCTKIPTPDGPVLGFLREWTDAVVGYGERWAGVEVTRDIGGDVRPAHVGHDLVLYGGLVLNAVANEPALNVELSRGLEFGTND